MSKDMKYLVLLMIVIPFALKGQSSWKKSLSPHNTNIEMFHSSQTANLPTTETLKKGNFMYEISHRFESISLGYDGLYGLDGPVSMRTALSYGFTDNLMVSLGRSNVQDNLDLRLKYKFIQIDAFFSSAIALQAGIAFNTEVFAGLKKRDPFDMNSVQYYGQAIYNVMFIKNSLGFGIVPSFLYNSFIFTNDYNTDKKYTFSIPFYLQYYFNRTWSLWVEVNAVAGGWKGNIFYSADQKNKSHNSLATGAAIETGGHIFFLFITNSSRLNPSQYLVGANNSFGKDAWRFAFGITREL